MINKKLEITVNANVTVSDEMAERCLRLIEIWMDDNPDKHIVVDKIEGKHRAHIKRWEDGKKQVSGI